MSKRQLNTKEILQDICSGMDHIAFREAQEVALRLPFERWLAAIRSTARRKEVALMSETPRIDPAGNTEKLVIPQNYAFVMNINRLIGATSYNIDQQHELRRATSDEITFIKDEVSRHAPSPQWLYTGIWEQEWPRPIKGKVNYLSEPDWRYYVIGLQGGIAPELQAAFDLAPVELEVGFSTLYLNPLQNGPGVACDPNRFFHVLERSRQDAAFFVDISNEEITTIQQIYVHLQQHDDRLVDVKRIAWQLGQLKGLPHHSPLRFLGYFAILESLLTHAPKPLDPYDSITRQVKKKLILLDHRWAHQIDYSSFGDAKPETVWATMYHYRSLVAHGGEPNFTGKLSLLKNEETALTLIKETAKAVVRQAIFEPQLLLDLRDC
ncbi:MAG: hypothetical protein ACLQPD_00380 [Desulfomonilaceae bacterium]